MNEALIGETIELDAPVDEGVVGLLVGAVKDFLVAAGGAEPDIDRLEEDLRGAINALTSGSSGGIERLQARLVLVASGAEIHLNHESATAAHKVLCPA